MMKRMRQERRLAAVLGVSSRNFRHSSDDDEVNEQCAGGPDAGR
jgi:hypothetical protein